MDNEPTTTPTPPTTPRPWQRAFWAANRTRVVTVASVVAVAVAGLFAVGATFGLIEPAADSNLGTIPPVAETTSRAIERIDLYADSNGNLSAYPGGASTPVEGSANGGADVVEVDAAPLAGNHDDDHDKDHRDKDHDDERDHKDSKRTRSDDHDDHEGHHHEGHDDDD